MIMKCLLSIVNFTQSEVMTILGYVCHLSVPEKPYKWRFRGEKTNLHWDL